jgi:hypothetical protein
MLSKTPNFDKALNEILDNLKPHQRKCQQCGGTFEIFQEDIDFYKKLRVPPPKLCPDCRRQTRLAFVNYTTLYKRRCSAPGHQEKIISQIPEPTLFSVYDFDYYWSGNWDPMKYARDYDFSKPFFEQIKELLQTVPQPANTRDPASINSEYTAYGVQLKNCYYTFGGLHSENVFYGHWPMNSRDCFDVLVPWDSERCYEVVYSKKCYHCQFVYFSQNCLDSAFLFDCRNCQNCFGCLNLRNKKYHFFNQPLTKEGYKKRLSEIDLGDRQQLEYFKEQFLKLLISLPKRNLIHQNNVNSTGTLLENCRDCQECFFVINGENLRYTEINLGRDCMDTLLGMAPSRCYYTATPYEGSELKFSVNSRKQSLGLEYCFNCKNCWYCFGCIGLVNKKFCIFNKQYSEKDYWQMVDKIKTQMLKVGEYGEFLPISFSWFPYNASLAQVFFPLNKDEAEKKGLRWVEITPSEFRGKILSSEEVPANIRDVKDDILNVAIRCAKTNRLFRVIKSELEFYRKENLPVPILHPQERLLDRFSWLGSFKLEPISCAKCGKLTMASFRKGIKENIYCEACYLQEVV